MNEQLEALITADEYILKLKNGIHEVVKNFQGGNEAVAFSLTDQVFEGIQWLIDVIGLTQDVQSDKIDTCEISHEIKEMVEAFENHDYILLSDLLQYEIEPVLDSWSKKMNDSINDKIKVSSTN